MRYVSAGPCMDASRRGRRQAGRQQSAQPSFLQWPWSAGAALGGVGRLEYASDGCSEAPGASLGGRPASAIIHPRTPDMGPWCRRARACSRARPSSAASRNLSACSAPLSPAGWRWRLPWWLPVEAESCGALVRPSGSRFIAWPTQLENEPCQEQMLAGLWIGATIIICPDSVHESASCGRSLCPRLRPAQAHGMKGRSFSWHTSVTCTSCGHCWAVVS